MLSFLYRLIHSFKREHGFTPNVVEMNESHYCALRENLPDMGHEEAEYFLEMHIALNPGVLHPQVSWHEPARKRAAG